MARQGLSSPLTTSCYHACGCQWLREAVVSGLTHGGLHSGDVRLGKAGGWCALGGVNGWVGGDGGGAASAV